MKKLFLFLKSILHPTSGTTGQCSWALTGPSDNYTLTIGGSDARMDNYKRNNNRIPWYAYRGSIQTLKLEDGVTNIGEHAFYDCRSLTSVTIPNSITSIDSLTGFTSFDINDI
jgi:hypothetical protein